HRNFGSCMAPQSAYLQTLGLETLSLRVKTSCENSLVIAEFLQQRDEVRKVNYPGLADSSHHELARCQFNGHYGGLLSFELGSKEEAFRFINKLKLIRRATNINDNKTLIIHPASTIFSDCSQEERMEMDVPDTLIRLSVGIENINDLINDISQALENLKL
ncbi:MAG: O-acetylhomoserine aminocarboxypropyltransferase/cysteine synthase, partial [Desulfobulbaceae bacterium]|nr:O-acetylhomoserine aminocarboxypropyltransferase/cysteine synthase [Desulfobulbaceae bacterium]